MEKAQSQFIVQHVLRGNTFLNPWNPRLMLKVQ